MRRSVTCYSDHYVSADEFSDFPIDDIIEDEED